MAVRVLAFRGVPPKPPRVPVGTKKPCEKCVYFDKGNCLLFFSQNPVEGSLTFYSAKDARTDEKLCGGKLFKGLKNNDLFE